MSPRWTPGLRLRLMTLVVGTALAGLALLTYVAWRDRQRREHEAEAEALQLVRVASLQHRQMLVGARQLLAGIFEAPELRSNDPRATTALFQRLQRSEPLLLWLARIAPGGRVFAASDPASRGRDVSGETWYVRAITSHDLVTGSGEPGEGDSGAPAIVMARALPHARSSPPEVLAVRLSLAWLPPLEAEVARFPGGVIKVIDDHGFVISRYPEGARWTGRSAGEGELLRLVRGKGEGVARLAGLDGVRRTYAFARLPGDGGHSSSVVVGFDEKVLYAAARLTYFRTLLVLAGVMLIVTLLAWRGLHAFVLRQLDALLATARRLSGGDLAARSGLSYRGGELGQLALAFDAMAASLLARQAERDRAERETRDSEARKTAILDVALDAIITIDQDGHVTEFNAAAQHLTGWSRQEAMGRTLKELIIPEELRGAHESGLRRCLETGDGPVLGHRLETTALRKDGTRIPVELTIARMRLADDSVSYAGYVRDIRERHRYEEALRTLSLVDDLTGLYNRRGFLTFGHQLLRLASRSSRPVHVLFADLDGLKEINDAHGHAEGDRALAAAAHVLRATFRRSDVVARIGGDEFAALALETTDRGIDVLEARVRERLAASRSLPERPWVLDLSLGHVRWDPAAPRALEVLLEEADRAMYERKRERREQREQRERQGVG